MTLAIGWPHEVGENLRTWPHEGDVWHAPSNPLGLVFDGARNAAPGRHAEGDSTDQNRGRESPARREGGSLPRVDARDTRRAEILLQIAPLLRPGNWHDEVPLSHDPCQRELGRGAAFLLRQGLNVASSAESVGEPVGLG